MATKVEIIYEAEATSLKATVNEVNKANDAVVASAQESSKKVADSYKSVGKSIASAFAGGEVKKALADQNKAFDDLNKKGVPLTRVLRGLKNELNALEESGQGGTAAFRKLTAEAARLEDQIGDTRARVSNLASDTFKFDAAVQATQGLAAGFEVAQGAAALFGSENEDLQKTIAKTTAAIAIANGLQQISALLLEESKLKTFALTAAQAAYNGVIALTSGALKGLRIALAATGVGALIVALGAVVAYWDDIKTSITGVSESQRNLNSISDKQLKLQQDKLEAIGNQDEVLKLQGKTEREILQLKVKQSEQTILAQEAAIKNSQTTLKLQIEAETRSFQTLRNIARFAIEVNLAVLRVIAAPLDLLITTANEIADALGFEKISSTINEQLSKLAQTGADTIAKLAFDPEETKKSGQAALAESDKALKDLQNQRAGFLNSIKDIDKKAADDAATNAKKAAEDLAKARENLAKLETDALQSQLDEREKILSESNAKIAELEKAFLESKFAAGSAEEKKLQNAILAIKEQATKSIAEIDQKALDDKAAKEKQAAEKAKQEAEKAAEERSKLTIAGLDAQINAIKTLEITEGTSLDRRIQLIELDSKKRIELAKDNASEIELINAQTEEAIRAERKKSRDEAIDQALEIAEAVADTLGSIIELQSIQSQKRIEEINTASEAEKLAIESSTAREVDKQRQLDALNTRTQLKISAEKTKQAKAEKAAAIFEATINAAAAAAKAAANPVQLAIAIAAGAAQIAIIAATPIPKFKKGGMVGGRSHEAGGTLIEAERGEYVVNKNSVMRNRRELDAINTSSAAFKRLIDERYVRPAILSYAMNNKRDGITVNASLNSKAMERKLDRLNKTMAGKQMIVNINGGDSRYTWQ
jgi:hypothetical protein